MLHDLINDPYDVRLYPTRVLKTTSEEKERMMVQASLARTASQRRHRHLLQHPFFEFE